MTAVIEGGEWSAARTGRTLLPGKTRYPLYRRLGGPQGRSGRAENLVPNGIFFYYQHTFIQVHCVHSSTYVTDTDSIVPAVRLFIGQWTLSPPTPPCLLIHLSLVHYTRTTRIHFPAPSLHTAQECKVDTLCGPCSTLSHFHSST